jgi:hypothetical protein
MYSKSNILIRRKITNNPIDRGTKDLSDCLILSAAVFKVCDNSISRLFNL